ncbi:hypothetical protein C404_19205 [Ralstonia sp. AU12-08]|nr:hypothetical protein C404_19205 [Ralstonia sp. AU12-08]
MLGRRLYVRFNGHDACSLSPELTAEPKAMFQRDKQASSRMFRCVNLLELEAGQDVLMVEAIQHQIAHAFKSEMHERISVLLVETRLCDLGCQIPATDGQLNSWPKRSTPIKHNTVHLAVMKARPAAKHVQDFLMRFNLLKCVHAKDSGWFGQRPGFPL